MTEEELVAKIDKVRLLLHDAQNLLAALSIATTYPKGEKIMTHEELERIYAQLESAAQQLQDLAKLLLEIKDKLASGGGPGEEKH